MSGRPAALSGAVLVLAVLLVAGCSGTAQASFNPAGPCTSDGRVAGAYPDLEALVPKMLGDRAPTRLDSGRNCTAANLGTLAGHGLKEIRFAGGLWTDGTQNGVTLAVFRAPGLQSDWMGEWYEASARAGRQTGGITLSKTTVAGRPANRMDLVNGDSNQTVITWPGAPGTASADGDVVFVVIAADEPESRIQEALAAFP